MGLIFFMRNFSNFLISEHVFSFYIWRIKHSSLMSTISIVVLSFKLWTGTSCVIHWGRWWRGQEWHQGRHCSLSYHLCLIGCQIHSTINYVTSTNEFVLIDFMVNSTHTPYEGRRHVTKINKTSPIIVTNPNNLK